MQATREQIQQEALGRAVGGQSMTNFVAIFHGFMAKGIPEDEIKPRENVFTFHAWRALGRQVRRGEHGVKVSTWVPMDKKTGEIVSELELPSNQTGVPLTYAVGGKQFIVMGVGEQNHPGELVALALP